MSCELYILSVIHGIPFFKVEGIFGGLEKKGGKFCVYMCETKKIKTGEGTGRGCTYQMNCLQSSSCPDLTEISRFVDAFESSVKIMRNTCMNKYGA
jgi:hypothetical protein